MKIGQTEEADMPLYIAKIGVRVNNYARVRWRCIDIVLYVGIKF